MATADVVPEHSDAFDTLLARKSRPSPAQAESDPLMVAILLASQELMRRPGDFKEQEIKDVLWSLSRVSRLTFFYSTGLCLQLLICLRFVSISQLDGSPSPGSFQVRRRALGRH